MKKAIKVLGITLLVVVLFLAVISAVLAGSMGGIGPFKFLHDNKIKNHAGNAAEYHCENIQQLEDSPLRGKRILFLGSSVTKGACALNQSMADDIAARDGAVVTKEAVNGTTLATVKKNSYLERIGTTRISI